MIRIDNDTIGNAAPISDWITAMEDAFRDTAAGKAEVPVRQQYTNDNNTLLVMPCFGKDYFSTKLVSVFPGNLGKKKPVIQGSVILNDGKTGEPLAVMDGGKITAMRTAAVGSVGIKYLSPDDVTNLGIIGLGIQGFHQALFACKIRPIKAVRILDRSIEAARRFRDRFNAFYRNIKVIPCRNSLELCKASDIIITATGSQKPVVPSHGVWWKGKTLIGIGSYKPDMREFPDEVFDGLEQLFVDTMHGLSETGDLIIPLKKGLIKKEQLYPIWDLVLKRRNKEGDTGFFKSVGMAAFDLYGARLVYERVT
jgi:ornithine cyclodeaminase/alanine dehydrogenase-like protein (mu-crystallin family)